MRRFVLALCLVLIPVAAVAQARGSKVSPKADAVSGTWSGELVAPAGRIAVTLQLKFDGKRAVTGTIAGLPNPGDVKSGTFDPKTGALKLQLGRSDGPAVLITLDGTVTKNIATGKLSGKPGDGEFKLTRKP